MLCKALSILAVVAALVLWPALSSAEFMARVVAVHEGDRVTIYHKGRHHIVSLKDIDCPELKQPYGRQAKHATAAYIGGREVVVRALQKDSKGRFAAEVFLLDGRNVSLELVKEGLAWWRPSKSGDRSLGDLEELARAEGKGLWSDPHPVPPWKWKAAKKTGRKFSN